MFTYDLIPSFLKHLYHQRQAWFTYHPNILLSEPAPDFLKADPRKYPRAHVNTWYGAGNADRAELNNEFLAYPPRVGYAVSMWFNNFEVKDYDNDWRWIWYWRAIVWHDLQDIVGKNWWPALASGATGGNYYYVIFQCEQEAAKAARYIKSLDTSVKQVGK